MNTAEDKVMELSTAIHRFVHDHNHISIGGFTINRNPMAAVYEIIRQRIKNLHLYAHSNGQGVDELIGAGCVSKLEIAYAGSGRFAPTCIRFRKAIESGAVVVEDYSNYQMTLRFLAGAMGVPFLPTRSGLGTSIVDKWGFPPAMRTADPKIPNRKMVVMDNPLDGWGETSRLVLVPAIYPDVTILHVQKADRQGTARIEGLPFADVEQAKAAGKVILTCEELVDPDYLRETPEYNQIPFFCADAVVKVPLGAFPTACYRYYDYDPVYLNRYRMAASDEERYRDYLNKFVYGVADHRTLLQQVGPKRIEMIKADPRRGYAINLDRKLTA
jgi:glutaconate CoA-transferase subunit A